MKSLNLILCGFAVTMFLSGNAWAEQWWSGETGSSAWELGNFPAAPTYGSAYALPAAGHWTYISPAADLQAAYGTTETLTLDFDAGTMDTLWIGVRYGAGSYGDPGGGGFGPPSLGATSTSDANAQAYMIVEDGGAFNANGSGLILGASGDDPAHQKNGVLTINGGSVTASQVMMGGYGHYAAGRINMNGGTLTTPYIQAMSGGISDGTQTIIQTGGVIETDELYMGTNGDQKAYIEVSGGTLKAGMLVFPNTLVDPPSYSEGQFEISTGGEVYLGGDLTSDADILALIAMGEITGNGLANNILMEFNTNPYYPGFTRLCVLSGCPAAEPPIPEPSTLSLLAVGVLMVCRRRRALAA